MTTSLGAPKPRLVIANRGEIAVRICTTARRLGWEVAVVAPAGDQGTRACRVADGVLPVPSYLDAAAIVEASRGWGAGFVHPGYGFLSENPHFGEMVEGAGLVFVGPTPASMAQLGNKERAKELAIRLGVPVAPTVGSDELTATDPALWPALLERAGIVPPYLVKASGGGGGRGMRVVGTLDSLAAAVERASQEALGSFGDPRVFIEPYLGNVRHVEAQVFGDGAGGGVFLGERECSLQRRHQKILEESPSPAVSGALRDRLGKAALELVKATHYRGAGTVEFLLAPGDQFYFLEVNTRLQVEHPVTEMVTGLDLVACQLELARGHWPRQLGDPKTWHLPRLEGHALEVRLTAEDPFSQFVPTPGALSVCQFPREVPGHLRVDAGVEAGDAVGGAYDPLMAKIIAWGRNRPEALARVHGALEDTLVGPCVTNQGFLLSLLESPAVAEAQVDTSWVEGHLPELLAALDGHPQRVAVAAQARSHMGRVLPQGPLVEVFWGQGSGLQTLSSPSHGLRFALFPKLRGQKVLLAHSRGPQDMAALWDEDYAPQGAQAAGALETIYAPMAGTIVSVGVSAGDTVEGGHIVCVLESMKIQMEVKTPVMGSVQEVLVVPGQVLGGPEPLVLIKRGAGATGQETEI